MSALNPSARAFAPARARVDLAPLLSVAAPLALLALALALVAPGLTVQDTWLTLVSGREVAEHGLPAADHLTVLASGHRWVDQQWLAGLALYGLALAGGVGLAASACALALVTAFGLAAHTAHRRGASPLTILSFVIIAVVAAPWGLQLRAQALALPLFALVLFLLLRDPRAERRSTLLVLPALALWANVHGSVVVGAALVVAYALRTRGWAYLAAPAMVFVSPYAPQLAGYYRMMLLDPPFGRYIVEWHRTTPGPLTATFYTLAAVALALVVRRRDRLNAVDGLVLVVTLAVALDAIRGVTWFALAAVALLPALATRRPGATRPEGRAASVYTMLAGGVVAASLAVIAAQPARALTPRIPEAVIGVIGQTHGRVLANEASADWLLWRLPELRGRIAYDVRFEVLTPAQIRRLLVWRKFEPRWQRAADGYSIVVDDPAHVSRLVAAGGWRRVLAGKHIAVAERIEHAR